MNSLLKTEIMPQFRMTSRFFDDPLFFLVVSIISINSLIAQVGIGVPAGESPEATLDVRFDSAVSPGFLMPRVTSFPVGDIAEGMLVYYHGVERDVTYYVFVDGEWRPLAETAGVLPPDTEAPTVPQGFAASNPSTTSIDVSWTASTDNTAVVGYYVYYSDGTLAANVTGGISTTISGLDPETTYTMYVTAYDAAGNESSASNSDSETTLAIACENTTYCQTSFENDLGCWSVAWSNGNYWYSQEQAHDGSYSLKITNLGAITSASMDFSTYASVDISFWYLTDGYDNGNPSDGIYLQYSNDNGATWESLVGYGRNEDRNGNFAQVSYNLSGASYMTANAQIRILAYANQGNDNLYLDLTSITGNCP
jgi:hypothetical protein